MTSFEIRAAFGRSTVMVGAVGGELERLIGGREVVAVTDANVRRLHGGFFDDLRTIVIAPGEASKTLSVVEELYGRFIGLGLDRSSFVLGVGGGVVTDLTGFAASTYMRGLPFGFAATTLLAQVDAAIGGKNGVDYAGAKNMVGVIRQPEFVLADPMFLRTLPPEELRCGLAETVKSALVADPVLFEFLEARIEDVAGLDEDAVTRAVGGAILVKAAIVEADEREGGERRKLNFGHTLGHALEMLMGLRHGEAVGIGMVLAARISEARGLLSGGAVQRIEALLERAGLPVRAEFDAKAVIEAVRRDKKKRRDEIDLVVLTGLGHAEIIRIPYHQLEGHIHDLSKRS